MSEKLEYSKPEEVIVLTNHTNGGQALWYWCEGCRSHHKLQVDGTPTIPGEEKNGKWRWNNNKLKPTITPSVLSSPDSKENRCHHYIRDGNIEYLSDCAHTLKGQIIPLKIPPIAARRD